MGKEIKPSKITVSRLTLIGVLLLGVFFTVIYSVEQLTPIPTKQSDRDLVAQDTPSSMAQQQESNPCVEMAQQVEDLARIKDIRSEWLGSYFQKLSRLNINR